MMKGQFTRIVAVLAAAATLGGTAFATASSAWAEDATTTTTPSTGTTATAPASAPGTTPATTPTNGADPATKAQNATPTTTDSAKGGSKTGASDASNTTASKPADGRSDAKAAPGTSASAPAANDQTANGPSVTWTAPERLYNGGYYHPHNTINVTISGLTKGSKYAVKINELEKDKDAPKSGDTDSFVYDSNSTKFTADGATETVTINLSEPIYASDYASDGKLRAVAELLQPKDGSNEGSYTVTAVSEVKDIPVANLDELVSLSNVRVEDPGLHTIGMKAHYSIDQSVWKDVSAVCLTVTTMHVLTATSTAGLGIWGGGPVSWDCTTGAVADDDLSNPAQATIGTVQDLTRNLGRAKYPNETYTAIGQVIKRGQVYRGPAFSKDNQFGLTADKQLTKNADDITTTITNLIESTRYGNWGYKSEFGNLSDLFSSKPNHAKNPMSLNTAYLVVKFKNGGTYTTNSAKIPDFTTKGIDDLIVKSGEGLTDANKDGVNDAQGNGVTGDRNDKATAGSVYRVYIDNLKDACKSLPDGQYCYWRGYVYSSPDRLDSPDGQNAAIRKDAQGRYYADFTIPAGYTGSHKIALYDSDGKLVGWTPITVGDGKGALAETGSATATIIGLTAMLMAAGITLTLAKRAHRI